MSHQRMPSEALRQPHSISLKVLRLSRPSLSQQHPLPKQTQTKAFPIDARAALSSSGQAANQESQFLLSPLLTLPPAFGAARVGQTFACTLCANNELREPDNAARQISGVRIVAEMQTPSQPSGVPLNVPLELTAAAADKARGDDDDDGGGGGSDSRVLPPGQTLQRNVRFELREEGTHLLAVTVAYTETQLGGQGRAASGRGRSFRKIYQFVAHQLLSVRTKTQALPLARGGRARYSLEAQLENLGDECVSLEVVELHPQARFGTTSLNWDADSDGGGRRPPLLNPHDIYQVAFLLQEKGQHEDADVSEADDGRVVLGQLSIQWTGAMGDKGALSTGWLSYRKR